MTSSVLLNILSYFQNGTGDANDIWMVEIEGANRGDKVQTVRSKILFVHYHARCLLHSHDKKLPKWLVNCKHQCPCPACYMLHFQYVVLSVCCTVSMLHCQYVILSVCCYVSMFCCLSVYSTVSMSYCQYVVLPVFFMSLCFIFSMLYCQFVVLLVGCTLCMLYYQNVVMPVCYNVSMLYCQYVFSYYLCLTSKYQH